MLGDAVLSVCFADLMNWDVLNALTVFITMKEHITECSRMNGLEWYYGQSCPSCTFPECYLLLFLSGRFRLYDWKIDKCIIFFLIFVHFQFLNIQVNIHLTIFCHMWLELIRAGIGWEAGYTLDRLTVIRPLSQSRWDCRKACPSRKVEQGPSAFQCHYPELSVEVTQDLWEVSHTQETPPSIPHSPRDEIKGKW